MKFLCTTFITVLLAISVPSILAESPASCEGYYSCYEPGLSPPTYETGISYSSESEDNDTRYDHYSPYYGIDEVADYGNYSDLPRQITSPGERIFIFSPRLLRWAAYDAQGYQVASGKANGGADFCEELGRPCHTPSGSFRIHAKKGADCISNTFPLPNGGALMPYCMFFQGGFAIHGSPFISNDNTSHGCIRVYTDAAQWLHRYFLQTGTKVIVLPY